jgi:hypothetical protein
MKYKFKHKDIAIIFNYTGINKINIEIVYKTVWCFKAFIFYLIDLMLLYMLIFILYINTTKYHNGILMSSQLCNDLCGKGFSEENDQK